MLPFHITSRPEKWWTEAIFHFYLILNVFVHILENIIYTVTTTTGISLCCRIDSAFCKEIAMTWVYTVLYVRVRQLQYLYIPWWLLLVLVCGLPIMCHTPSPLFLVTLNMTQIGSGRERNQESWLISSFVRIVVY